MAEYHKFVFDSEKRTYVGKFEEMYLAETTANFDSWHQEDSRQIQRRLCLALLEDYNFNHIVDLGCGKGTLTHVLKKRNNLVTGTDLSETAIKRASSRYPDINFLVHPLSSPEEAIALYQSFEQAVDLTFSSELFSYIECWREIVPQIADFSRYVLVKVMIPPNPIGFVKSPNDFFDTFEKSFDCIEKVSFHNSNFYIFFGKTK